MENVRLKELLHQKNMTAQDLSDLLGYSRSTVDSWLNGRRSMQRYSILHIELLFHLNPGWLEGEDVPMYAEEWNEDRKKLQQSLMNCTNDFAMSTMLKLSEYSEQDWKNLESSWTRFR